MSEHQRQLMEAFGGFTEAWLKANQDGYMPFEQRSHFEAWASPWHQDGAMAIMTLIIGVATSALFVYRGEWGAAVLMILFWGGMGGVLLWYAWQDHLTVKADLRKGHVSSVCGEIETVYRRVRRNKELHDEYTFKIVDKPNSWKITKTQYELLRDGNVYRIYYPPNTGFLVSIEHLPHGCGEFEQV